MVLYVDYCVESPRQPCEVRTISLPTALMRKLNSEDRKLDSNPGGLVSPPLWSCGLKIQLSCAAGLGLSARPVVSTQQMAARGMPMIVERGLQRRHGGSWGHQMARPGSGPCLALRTRSDDTAL